MQTEIEVKFCAIDLDEMRQKLAQAGGELELPMRLMRRVAIHNDFMRNGKDSFLRVRDEGDKTTLTYKQYDSLELHGAKEIEVIVSDFDKTIEILAQAGLKYHTYQETRRETWRLGDCEVVLDEWPWLKPYMEIEGPIEQSVWDCAAKLGCAWGDAVFGDVMAAYRVEYPHLGLKDTIATISSVRFGDALPGLLKNRA